MRKPRAEATRRQNDALKTKRKKKSQHVLIFLIVIYYFYTNRTVQIIF